MTIFDVIRYPISDLPTLEELKALPPEIMEKWTHGAFGGDTNPESARSRMRLLQILGNGDLMKLRVEELRKVIKEWNT